MDGADKKKTVEQQAAGVKNPGKTNLEASDAKTPLKAQKSLTVAGNLK